MAIRYTFCKDERLKREQHIQTLFRTGKAFSVFPVRLVWLLQAKDNDKYPARTGFSVPKKKFRHATDRNRVKRLLREVWRTNKHEIYEAVPQAQQLHLFIIFTDITLPDLPKVSNALIKAIDKLKTAIAQSEIPKTATE